MSRVALEKVWKGTRPAGSAGEAGRRWPTTRQPGVCPGCLEEQPPPLRYGKSSPESHSVPSHLPLDPCCASLGGLYPARSCLLLLFCVYTYFTLSSLHFFAFYFLPQFI